MKNFDIVLSQAVSTTSGINDNMFNGHFSPVADFGLLSTARSIADEEHLVTYVGGTVCNDEELYRERNYKSKMWKEGYGDAGALNRRAAHFIRRQQSWMPGSDDGGNHNRNPL